MKIETKWKTTQVTRRTYHLGASYIYLIYMILDVNIYISGICNLLKVALVTFMSVRVILVTIMPIVIVMLMINIIYDSHVSDCQFSKSCGNNSYVM